LALGKAPAVDGLYRRADLGDSPLVSAEESELNTAVFVTHLYLDHMAYMGMVSDSVPVYLSEPAQIIEKALAETGDGADSIREGYSPLVDRETVRVGAIEVEPILLWDDSCRDFSFYVKTPDIKLHYTGNLILHAGYEQAELAEMEYIREERVDILVCDSCSFGDEHMLQLYGDTEAEVVSDMSVPEGMMDYEAQGKKTLSILEEQKGLCVINFYARETSFMEDFEDMARRCGRRFVLEPEAAYLYWRIFGREPSVFLPDFARFWETPRAPWLGELLEHSHIVEARDIEDSPRGYLLQNSYRYALELFSLPNEGASYLHAGGVPMGDFDPAYERLKRLLDMAGFKYIPFFDPNYFDHAYPQQAKYYVDRIDARTLIPCHGFHPERLKAPTGRVQFIPAQGQPYSFDHETGTLYV
jgi:ribonuclease J